MMPVLIVCPIGQACVCPDVSIKLVPVPQSTSCMLILLRHAHGSTWVLTTITAVALAGYKLLGPELQSWL